MMSNVLMPLGYVDDSHENGGAFSLARPTDGEKVKPGTPILIRNEHQHFNAIALMRGEVTEVVGVTASFVIQESHIHPNWPDHIDPKGYGNPVYLGIPGTFDPDFSRGFATAQEASYLWELALEHQEATGIAPRGAGFAAARPARPEPDDEPDFMPFQE